MIKIVIKYILSDQIISTVCIEPMNSHEKQILSIFVCSHIPKISMNSKNKQYREGNFVNCFFGSQWMSERYFPRNLKIVYQVCFKRKIKHGHRSSDNIIECFESFNKNVAL